MSLTFKCNTGGETFPAEITGTHVIYTVANRRVELNSEDQDCEDCANEIAREASAITEEARARVRARKQNGS